MIRFLATPETKKPTTPNSLLLITHYPTMTLTHCHKCQYFNRNPHHNGDIVCSQDPAYAEMWKHLHSLDQYTIGCLPVDDCGDFDPDPTFAEKEITLTLTLSQWQQTAFESSNPAITHAIRNVEISSRISLTQKQWQQIAESTTIDTLSHQLEQEGIEPEREIKQWIRVQPGELLRFQPDSPQENSSNQAHKFDFELRASTTQRIQSQDQTQSAA
jgi:hypothetical protein